MNAIQVQEFLKNIENAGNAGELADAVKALAEAQIPETAPNLIRALNYNNPGAAVAAVDGLIGIGKPAVLPLLELLNDDNYGARAWALRALSGIGDPRSLPQLLDTAKNDFALSVRRAAAKGLGGIKWVEMDAADRLLAQQECCEVLESLCIDPEWVVRYAAISGLESLGVVAQSLIPAMQRRLGKVAQDDVEVAVRSRALLALDRL
jgi:phycocyanobilin lyase subunit beta